MFITLTIKSNITGKTVMDGIALMNRNIVRLKYFLNYNTFKKIKSQFSSKLELRKGVSKELILKY